MPENNDRVPLKDSGYSPEFKEFFIKQLELLMARMQEFGQSMKIGWGDEMNCGFDQISQQISKMSEKMEVAIISQRQLIDELRELRAAQKRQAQVLSNE